MQPKLTIQERLKDLRVERGLTLEQLSAETGISKSALGKYEADDFKDISPFSMVELAKFYGVSTDYLLGLTEQKNHPNTELDALHLGDDAIEVLRTCSYLANSYAYVPLPPVMERSTVQYPNNPVIGMSASITCFPPAIGVMPSTRPRLLFRSPITSPV